LTTPACTGAVGVAGVVDAVGAVGVAGAVGAVGVAGVWPHAECNIAMQNNDSGASMAKRSFMEWTQVAGAESW
jgi:hypothetical protein